MKYKLLIRKAEVLKNQNKFTCSNEAFNEALTSLSSSKMSFNEKTKQQLYLKKLMNENDFKINGKFVFVFVVYL